MNKGILKILCCPTCKGQLEIEIKKENDVNIIDASLNCKKCMKIYIIKDSIPYMMNRDVLTFYKDEYTPLDIPLDIYSVGYNNE